MAGLKVHVEVLGLSGTFGSFVQMPGTMIALFLMQVCLTLSEATKVCPKVTS